MKKFMFTLAVSALATGLAVTSCNNLDNEEPATVSLSSKYADIGGEAGSTADIEVTSNYDNITAEKDGTADWLDVKVEGKTVVVTALTHNDTDEERWVNVLVTVSGPTASNKATEQFTARQSVNSDLVKIIPEKTRPVISAAARAADGGYTGEDNRYIIKVELQNTTDFDIGWDRTQTWITNVEKYYESTDGSTEILTGIQISVTRNDGTASRSAGITLTANGAEDVTITLHQKNSPFDVKIGDYDAENEGTVVYLDVENYNFYLVLDDKELKTPFFKSWTTDNGIAGASSVNSTADNIAKYQEKYGEKFIADEFGALYWCFNRNNTTGTQWTTFSQVPEDVISDETKWHLPSRNEIAYIFKRTIYENYIIEGATTHTFNDVLNANATQNSVEIAEISKTGTIYYSSTEGQNGSNTGKIYGYATTNLNKTTNKNETNPYSATESTKSYSRCVKKIFVNDND